jgi:hypothetical protein
MLMSPDSAENEKAHHGHNHNHGHACSRRKLRTFLMFSLILGISLLVFTTLIDFFAYDVDVSGPGSLWARALGDGTTGTGTESDFTKRKCK